MALARLPWSSGNLKCVSGLPRIVARAESQIFVEPVGLDHFAGIHLPVGIPDRLELAEGLHQFRAKHFGEKFGAGLAVSVFAGERAAVADDEVGGLFHELAEFAHAFGGFEIVIHARVDAGVAEVSVERAVVVVGVHQLAQIAQIGAEFFGSDGGIFEAFPAWGSPGTCEVAPRLDSRTSQMRRAWRGSVNRRMVGGVAARSRAAIRCCACDFGFGGGVGAEFDQQPAAAFRQQRQAFELMPLRRLALTMMSSKPSRPMGRCSMICGTWSAH